VQDELVVQQCLYRLRYFVDPCVYKSSHGLVSRQRF
jgi:hypothetical protein